jgi:hypothetical protein
MKFWLGIRLRKVTLRHAGALAPVSPRPYKGFTSGRADLVDWSQDASDKPAVPEVGSAAGRATAGYPQVLH